MWRSIGLFILKYRIALLLLLIIATGFMFYKAKEVQLSYEFTGAIPKDNPKYKAYQEFRKKFGEDGNLLVIGLQSDKLFQEEIFNDYNVLSAELKKINGVEDVISATTSINLIKNPETERLFSQPIFRNSILTQSEIDSSKNVFFSLPFYRHILYNPETNAWLMGVRINKEIGRA